MTQKFGTRRKHSKAETRRIIFETAYALFEENGYEKVTMRDLAAQAGVGLGTIFKHFKDKSTLLISVFQHEFQPLVDHAFKTIPQADLKTQLLYLVRMFYAFYAKRPHLSRILIKEVYVDLKNSEKIRDSFLRDINRIEAIFESAQQRGELHPKIITSDAVMIWWSYYIFVLFQGLQQPHFDLEAQIQLHARLIDQHLSGIGS